ncbi:MAG: tetratricopeptide repeat protein [Xanthobacteraceae bacterium]
MVDNALVTSHPLATSDHQAVEARQPRRQRDSVRQILIAATTVLMAITSAAADDESTNESIRLELAPGHPGEVRTETTLTEWKITESSDKKDGFTTELGRIYTSKAETFELRVIEITPSTISYTRQMKRFRFVRMELRTDRKPIGIFLDTDCKVDRNPVVERQLSTVEYIVQAADGSILRHEAVGSDTEFNAMLQVKAEQDIENRVRLLPDHPVRLHEVWQMGKQESSAPGIALVTYEVRGQLARIIRGGLPELADTERAAVIATDVGDVDFKFDEDRFPMSDLTKIGTDVKFTNSGRLVFSLDRHEIVSRREEMEGAFKVAARPSDVTDHNIVAFTARIRTGKGNFHDVSGDEAFSDYISIFGTLPELASIFASKALDYGRNGDVGCIDDVIDADTAAIELNPEGSAVSLVRRGAVYLLGNNQVAAAIADFSKAVEVGHSGFATGARLWRGLAHLKERNFDAAISDFSKVIEANWVAEGFHGRALAYLKAGKPNLGLPDAERAIEAISRDATGPLDSRNASNFYLRGLIREALGDRLAAIADFRTALGRWLRCREETDPPNRILIFQCGVEFPGHRVDDVWAALKRVGGYDQAIDEQAYGAKRQPNISPFVERASAHIERGELERAIAEYSEAIRLDPDRATAFFDRAAAYYMKGDLDRAIADYDQAIRLRPDFAPAFKNRGLAHFFVGEFSSAMADLEQSNRLAALWDKPQWMVWRFLVRGRMGGIVRQPDVGDPQVAVRGVDPAAELAASAATVKTDEWPVPMIDVYLGRRTVDEMRATAQSSGDKCRLGFFLGELLLVRGEDADASKELSEAVDNCPKGSTAYVGASAELKRLRH